jgi:hypothetical protein
LACLHEFFVNKPFDVKENKGCLDFFGLGEFGLFCSNTHVWLMVSSPNAFSNHCQDLRCTFPEICTKSDEITLGQIHDSK